MNYTFMRELHRHDTNCLANNNKSRCNQGLHGAWPNSEKLMTPRISLILLSMLVVAACSNSTGPALQTGDDAELTHDGLVRVDNTIMDSVWARPGIDL